MPQVCETPPVNDKGAETISAPSSNRILIDFLAWTLKVVDPVEALKMSGFDASLFTPCDIGGMGYRKSYRYGHIVCFHDGNDDMGCHISLSGQGCREFEALNQSPYCWEYLFRDLLTVDASFSRLDLAIDNVDGRLSLARLEQAVKTKSIRSYFKKYKKFEEGTLSRQAQSPASKTIQVGSVSSRCMIRFYNKAAEQEGKHHLAPGTLGHWSRCELVLRAERAHEAVNQIASGVEISFLAVAVLNHYFAVVKVTSDNLSQCKLRRWWSSWLTTTEKLRLTTEKAIRYVMHAMQHVERQYSATFAMIKKHLGVTRFHDFVHNLVHEGVTKMNKKHFLILASSRPPVLVIDLPF